MARKNIEITEQSDVMVQRSAAVYDVRLNSKKASILRRLSAGLSVCLSCMFVCVCVCLYIFLQSSLCLCVKGKGKAEHLYSALHGLRPL